MHLEYLLIWKRNTSSLNPHFYLPALHVTMVYWSQNQSGWYIFVCYVIMWCQRKWESQPYIKSIPAGNLLLSAAMLFAGARPTKTLRVLNLLRCATIKKWSTKNYTCIEPYQMFGAVSRGWWLWQIRELKPSIFTSCWWKCLLILVTAHDGSTIRISFPSHCQHHRVSCRYATCLYLLWCKYNNYIEAVHAMWWRQLTHW